MYRRRSLKPIIITMSSLMIVAIIGIVWAVFTGQLTISNGSGVGRASSWDVHFENLSTITTTHTAKVLTQPRLASSTSIEDYSVSVTSPGDTISFTVKMVNNGNYNAKITSVSVGTPTCSGTDTTSNTNVCNHLHYSLTYDNGATVAVNDIVYAKDYKVLKVTLNYDDTVTASQLPTSEVSISGLGITINFEQSGDALVKDNGEVANYTVYHQGDKITLNNEDYYVITNSGAGQDYVVALKYLPLTVAEVNLYGGVGTENNHVNKNVATSYSQGTAGNDKGYGQMAYYSSETCGYVNGNLVTTNCIKIYEGSDIEYTINNWIVAKFGISDLKEIDGYKARLLFLHELSSLSTYSWINNNSTYWLYNNNPNAGELYRGHGAGLTGTHYVYTPATVRPIINVYKSALEVEEES